MVTAQKFMLVDRHGKTRGEFNVTSKGVAKSRSSTAPGRCVPVSASALTAHPLSAFTARTASRAPKSESPTASPASFSSTPMRPRKPPSASRLTANPGSA